MLVSWILSLFLCCLPISHALSSPVALRISIGSIVGELISVENSSWAEVYNSVPYAQPPLGKLRFEVPVPLAPSTDRIDTTRSSRCPSLNSFLNEPIQNEDCLHMKVVVPLDEHGNRYAEPLPVVFWIHGGSFNYMSKEMYRSENVIRHFSSKKIIFVAPNYRLAALGFLTALHPDLSGNYGLEDQLLAIKLFLENAAAFGADPSRVVVAGESAGAAAAGILAVSPRSQGLFSSAILISGSSLSHWAVRSHSSEISSAKFINACNCNRSSVLEMKQCMQRADLRCANDELDRIYGSSKKSWYEGLRMGGTVFTPVVDVFRINDSIIPMRIEYLVRKNARLPVLISVTEAERADSVLLDYYRNKTLGNSKKFDEMMDSLISWNTPSRKYIIEAMKNTFLRDLTEENVAEKLGILLSGDMSSASYEEAMFYASAGNTVYAMESRVHRDQKSVHGHDTSSLFGSKELTYRCENCDAAVRDAFAAKWADVLTQFINQRSISGIEPFTRETRLAHQVTENGTSHTDWNVEAYYFWRHTVPLLSSLSLYPDSPVVISDCPPVSQSTTHHLLIYLGTALLISLLVSLFLTCWCCRRRIRRKRVNVMEEE